MEYERRYKILFNSIGECAAVCRVMADGGDFVFSDVNASMEQIENIPKEALIGESVLKVFPESKTVGLSAAFEQVWRTGTTVMLSTASHSNGQISRRRRNKVYKLDENDILWLYKDETDEKLAEQDRINLENIVLHSNDAIVGLTTDGVIQAWNKGAERIFGYSRQEVMGKPIFTLHSQNRPGEFAVLMKKILRGERVDRHETVRIRKDGKKINVSLTFSPIKNEWDKIIGASVIYRDITEKMQMERHLRDAQKRQALGTLAAGIAHDFNNILFPIMGYAEMTMVKMPEDSVLKKNLAEILKAAHRARDLIQHILIFSREAGREKKPLQIHLLVKEVVSLIRAALPSTIQIRQDIKNCGTILANPAQIHQIIMNLCTNAHHAMGEKGGVLGIELSEETIDRTNYAGISPGRYVSLSVTDTGCGIEPHVMDNIFDPYFTTKKVEEGTGLGLFIVRGILKECGGDIRVCSEPGKGTTFHLYFPENAVETVDEEVVQDEPTHQNGCERILIVDDEKQITLMVQKMLENAGYSVICATDSLDALELFRQSPDDYDLVVTDYTMPNMVGVQLAKQMMSIRPDLPVILCSGFSEPMGGVGEDDSGIRRFLMKPIIRKDLLKAVRDALDHRGNNVPDV